LSKQIPLKYEYANNDDNYNGDNDNNDDDWYVITVWEVEEQASEVAVYTHGEIMEHDGIE